MSTATTADLGHVAAGAEAGVRARGLSSRCRTEAIDFFRAVPSGGDAYISTASGLSVIEARISSSG